MKQTILNNLKNIPGWSTKRKLVVFSVDDFGNVRLDSKQARLNMDKAGMKILKRFDAYDALETREDLELLYDSLKSVKDKNGRHAVFTPYTVPCNINFEEIARKDFKQYEYELLPETFKKLASKYPAAYNGTWELWQQGIKEGLMAPQFHGREHLNLKIFEEKLSQKDKELLTALENRSYTSISKSEYSTIGYTEAFAFSDLKDVEMFPEIISTGLKEFENVFKYPATVFTPPAHQFPKSLEVNLSEFGFKAIDKSFMFNRHLGSGKYRKEFNFLKFNKNLNLSTLVRNVVFEPIDERGFDWVNFSLKQIEAAFRWNKPANISSHRLNFSGFISPANRQKSISDLKELLKKIVVQWPEVEFISADQLADLVAEVET